MKPSFREFAGIYVILNSMCATSCFCPVDWSRHARWLRPRHFYEAVDFSPQQSSLSRDPDDDVACAEALIGVESKELVHDLHCDRRVMASTPKHGFSSPLHSLMQVVGSTFMALGAALALITWETICSEYALPSRQTRSSVVREELYNSDSKLLSHRWGKATVQGMGFGYSERRFLSARSERDEDASFQLSDRESYNEIMLRHRRDRLPSWKQKEAGVPAASIHTVLAALESLPLLKALALDYQWDQLRESFHSDLWHGELDGAAAQLRNSNELTSSVIGFDWGSCAWRHCGAWADWQESFDQLDALLGLLEPQEVAFCLDIVERSLREVLAVVPRELWDKADWEQYQRIPHYRPYEVSESDATQDDVGEVVEDPYLQALMELRVD